MIEDGVEVKPRTIVQDEFGRHYRVDSTNRIDATGEHNLGFVGRKLIDYTLIEDGEYPAGTRFGKDEAGFRRDFTIMHIPVQRAVLDVLDELGH